MINRLLVWKDKKRILGMPISFTNYSFTMDRLFVETGIFTKVEEQVLLYRIRDISTRISLFQKLFKVGTVKIISVDSSTPNITLTNVKNAKCVAQMLYEKVEMMKKERRIRVGELMETTSVDLEDIYNE